jgi:acyl dehydratase
MKAMPITALDVGDELPQVILSVSQELIRNFSAIAQDRNASHYDDQVARAHGFPGALVHGAIAISLALRVLTYNGSQRFADDDDLQLTFVAPVSPGDTLSGRARVTEVSGDKLMLEVWCENQRGEKVITGHAHRRKPR